MRYEITAPERRFSGEVAGVHFSQGRATLDTTATGSPAALAYFRRRGYGVAEAAPPEPTPEPTQKQEPGPEQGQGNTKPPAAYNPGEHSAEDVLAYLDTADLAEAERVLQAESDGKARKTILNAGGPLLARKEQGEKQ